MGKIEKIRKYITERDTRSENDLDCWRNKRF